MNNKSIWELTTQIENRSSLENDVECDILVIGAGLGGILTAYFLTLENRNVIIIDKKEIASGATKNTTAKITAQHNLIYSKLLKTIGFDKTKSFYQANIDALNKYKEIIKKENIDCDFESTNSYVYSLKKSNKLKNEYAAYKKLGINGYLTKETSLPFTIDEALVMENQATFNPLKFIKDISQSLKIYEHTRMVKIDNNTVTCQNGAKIKANKIIIATQFPIIDYYGYFFIKQHQSKSYLLALKNANKVNGMYIDNNKNGFTIRDYKDYVLFGGFGHKTGKKSDKYYFNQLEKESKKHFKESVVIARFCAQDCMSLDHMPYIGKYAKNLDNVYVLSGFNKWGMTGSMIGAMILNDLINNRDNKYSKLLSPSRFNTIASIPNLTQNLFSSIYGLFIKRIIIKRKDVVSLNPGENLIIKYKKKYLGVYKDNDAQIHIVDARCPHLGCILAFNKEELAYECPCHGSKFDFDGNLLYSPSIHDLKKHHL